MKTGDKVRVRDKGTSWTTAVYLYTTKHGKHICQSQYNWDCSNIPLESWDEVKPISKTETRVKKASEIMKWLEKRAEIDDDGDWTIPYRHTAFTRSMWKYCGKKPSSHWKWHPEWLEEVEI